MKQSRGTGKKIQDILREAIEGVNWYLDENKTLIRQEIYESAKKNVPEKLEAWLSHPGVDALSPHAKDGIVQAIEQKRWANLIDAFLDEIAFGTGGIRGVAAFASRSDESELVQLHKEGIQAPILRGPNTINDLVLMLKSAGVAKYARENGLKAVVIGYDSRIQGGQFAELITRIFLAQNMTVYLFDNACPYPELTFAIPHLRADMGILISASHNDRRYNGYKLSAGTGAQFEKAERDKIFFRYISHMKFEDVEILPEIRKNCKNLFFLGGDGPLPGRNYYERESSIINMHQAHRDHIRTFILDDRLLEKWAPQCRIGYSAYHGAGRIAVPALLRSFHFNHVQIIQKLNELDGLFPCFALEQQPDPGDNVAAEVAVQEFKAEYGEENFGKLDLLIGTDPDADRAGFIVKVPEKQKRCYAEINRKPASLLTALKDALPHHAERKDYDWHLLDADNAWTLLLWYRLMKETELNGGRLPDSDKKFISLSHTTSDSMVRLVRQYGLGVIKTWVGFAYLANSVYMAWNGRDVVRTLAEWNQRDPEMGTGDPEKDLGKKIFAGQAHAVLFDTLDMEQPGRKYNFAALEQSNGFSILGPKPAADEVWGKGGHVRDKDGTFAAILLAEVQAYAKSRGLSLIELLDQHIYLDPDIGLFVGYYEPEPYWGQFEGPAGMSKKINLLKETENLQEGFEAGNALSFAGQKTVRIESYRTGKYDGLHRWKHHDLPYCNGFPDEGIRFFFDEEGYNHLTVRPSGTSQCLRFHIQLKGQDVRQDNLCHKKEEYYRLAKDIVADARKKIGC
ncbi:hypothetical protein JW906_02075 [bacterium]|nr:hypothetical protein [bacterium]